jgi:hypothetical protein
MRWASPPYSHGKRAGKHAGTDRCLCILCATILRALPWRWRYAHVTAPVSKPRGKGGAQGLPCEIHLRHRPAYSSVPLAKVYDQRGNPCGLRVKVWIGLGAQALRLERPPQTRSSRARVTSYRFPVGMGHPDYRAGCGDAGVKNLRRRFGIRDSPRMRSPFRHLLWKGEADAGLYSKTEDHIILAALLRERRQSTTRAPKRGGTSPAGGVLSPVRTATRIYV